MAGRTDTQPSSPLSRAKRPSNPHLPCTILPSLLVVLLSVPPPPRASSSSTWGDPLDESCLRNLYTSLQLPYSSNDEVVLRNWTPSTFSSPCDGFTSFLEGATCNNGRVLKLSLRHLSLSGSISPFLSNCTNLQSLDLSSNSLTGPIPPDLSLLSNLAFLNLSRNRLEGPIPPGLSHCTYLNALDLHSNLLSGPIPEQLGLLPRLSFLDLSDNRLDGPVPALLSNRSGTGLPRFNSSSFAGNRGLYGYPLGPPRDTRRRGVSVAVIVGIGLGSGMVSLVLSFTVVCIWLRVTERREEEVRRLEEEEENHNKVAPKFD